MRASEPTSDGASERPRGRGGEGATPRPCGEGTPPSKPKRGSGGCGASSACPPGLIYMLSRPVRGGRTPGARSLAAGGAARTLAPGLLPPPLGARREPDEREAREGAPGLSLSLWPPFLPAAGPPGAMLTLGKLRTALGGGRGGGRARVAPPGKEGRGGGGGGGWRVARGGAARASRPRRGRRRK